MDLRYSPQATKMLTIIVIERVTSIWWKQTELHPSTDWAAAGACARWTSLLLVTVVTTSRLQGPELTGNKGHVQAYMSTKHPSQRFLLLASQQVTPPNLAGTLNLCSSFISSISNPEWETLLYSAHFIEYKQVHIVLIT